MSLSFLSAGFFLFSAFAIFGKINLTRLVFSIVSASCFLREVMIRMYYI